MFWTYMYWYHLNHFRNGILMQKYIWLMLLHAYVCGFGQKWEFARQWRTFCLRVHNSKKLFNFSCYQADSLNIPFKLPKSGSFGDPLGWREAFFTSPIYVVLVKKNVRIPPRMRQPFWKVWHFCSTYM